MISYDNDIIGICGPTRRAEPGAAYAGLLTVNADTLRVQITFATTS
jgi:hypothetical protein